MMKLASMLALAASFGTVPVSTGLVLGGFAFASATTAEASDCTGQNALTTRCKNVADQGYAGGGSNPKTVPIEACLSRDMVDSIKLDDGTYAWEVGFYYGIDDPEVVLTVKNDDCWTKSKSGKVQTGVPGAWVVAFICCDYYCGWVGGLIGADGKVALRPIEMPRQHDPLG